MDHNNNGIKLNTLYLLKEILRYYMMKMNLLSNSRVIKIKSMNINVRHFDIDFILLLS